MTSNAGQTHKFVWARLGEGDWERVDAVRGEMSRREWVRQAFFSQLAADEKDGTVAGLTPEENPYDGGMPYGLPRPDPYDASNTRHKRKGKRGQVKPGDTRPPDAATELRHIQVISLANSGRTTVEIAQMTGYAQKTVNAIIRKSLRKFEMAAVQDYREWTLRQHLEIHEGLEETIRNPGPVVSATGNIVTDANGVPLIDKGERTRAYTEQRKNLESIRREVGTDAPSQRHVTLEEQGLENTMRAIMAALANKRIDEIEGAVDGEWSELPVSPASAEMHGEAEQPDDHERGDGEEDALADAGELQDERDGEGDDGGDSEHGSTS